MNDTVYTEVREETKVYVVNTLIQGGWMLLDTYKRKEEVKFSQPKEFQEVLVYVLGNTMGG